MDNKQMVKEITNIEVDFAKWYTDIVKKAKLCEYSSVKGCMIIEPYGYAIWENISNSLDKEFKKIGVENCAMPMFIPESLLKKEKDHVEGFSPECAWVTHGGDEELEERLCVRPTSETLFCDYYKNTIKSYRDLPKLLNQWVSVVRWEKTTRPFLRSREFYWQEGHTAHRDGKESEEFTIKMLNVYADFLKNFLAIPVIKGQKTDSEKFAGAEATYTVEAMMHDGKALQSATSHNFGSGFAEAFKIQYLDESGELKYVSQTSWGLSTRIIGAIIMVHGDNEGLKLPPYIAPIQVIVVPIKMKDEKNLEKAKELCSLLKEEGIRATIDLTDKSPGYKFADSEMRGIPLRIEIGPKDIENNQVVLVRRDTHEKIVTPIFDIQKSVKDILEEIHINMCETAKKHLNENIREADTLDEMVEIINEKSGFVRAMHCGCKECEKKLKEGTTITTRCIPFEKKLNKKTCIVCGKPAKYEVIFGRSY